MGDVEGDGRRIIIEWFTHEELCPCGHFVSRGVHVTMRIKIMLR
jgi:hypothetical protein